MNQETDDPVVVLLKRSVQGCALHSPSLLPRFLAPRQPQVCAQTRESILQADTHAG